MNADKKPGWLSRLGDKIGLAAGATGLGLGLGFAKMLFDLYKSDRAIGLQVIDSAPLLVALLFTLALWHMQSEKQIEQQRQGAAALADLAAANREVGVALKALSEKDDRRAREQDIMLDHLTRTMERVEERTGKITEWIDEQRAKGS